MSWRTISCCVIYPVAFKMGRGTGMSSWRPVDYILVTLLVLGGTATILVGVLPNVLGGDHWGDYEQRPARVTGVNSAMTRCDDCVERLLDGSSSSGGDSSSSNEEDGHDRHGGRHGELHEGEDIQGEHTEGNPEEEPERREARDERHHMPGSHEERDGDGDEHRPPPPDNTGEHHQPPPDDTGEHRQPPPDGVHEDGRPRDHDGMPREHDGKPGERDRHNSPPTGVDDPMPPNENIMTPDWWMASAPDEETRKLLEETCPLVPALYISVTYTDDDGKSVTAIVHPDVHQADRYPTHSYSNCDGNDRRHGKNRKRRQINGDAPPSGGDTGAPVPPPGGENTNMGTQTMQEVADEFKDLFGSRIELPVFVDPDDPHHAVVEEPYRGPWICRKFIPLIIFTFVIAMILMVRRIVVYKKAQRVRDVDKKPALYAINDSVVVIPIRHPTKAQLAAADPEKNPADLGPEVVVPTTRDVTVLTGKTVMTSGLAGDVTTAEKEAEAFSYRPSTPRSRGDDVMAPVGDEVVVPPVYSRDSETENRPPTYSSIDLSKY